MVPGAVDDALVAATNAVPGPTHPVRPGSALGGFTDPEYARVGHTEAKARQTDDIVTTVRPFDSAVRTVIEGRTVGFCKLVVDRGAPESWDATWWGSARPTSCRSPPSP